VVVSVVGDDSGLAEWRKIGKKSVAVPGVAGATRVDGSVWVSQNDKHVGVTVGLPGFAASKNEISAAEGLATTVAGKL